MKTALLLMAEFETAEVPLSTIADKYLGMTPRRAAELAGRQALPFPAHRVGSGQKAPWLVSVIDLAHHLDCQREAAAREWRNVRASA